MTTNNSILVSCVRSNKSDNMVWAVYAQGNEQQTCYCKSPYAAMKMAFLQVTLRCNENGFPAEEADRALHL